MRRRSMQQTIRIVPLFIIGAFLSSFYGNSDNAKMSGLAGLLPGFSSAAWAKTDATIKAPAWPHASSDLKPDPALIFGQLSNGIRYILMPNTYPLDRVSMHLNIQAGSLNETDAQQGIAHFLEHALFNGSEHFKPGELVKFFQRIGMQFGPDANAHTGFNETVYDILLPDGDEQSLKEGLLVLYDYADGALLLSDEIDRERRVVLAEKRTRDSASYRTFEKTLKFEFPGARVSSRLPIGKAEVIETAGRPLLKDFYDTWYRPTTMSVIIVGDFDTKIAARLIEKRFSTLAARAPKRTLPGMGKIAHQGVKPFYHFEKEAGATDISIEVVEKIAPEHDSAALQKMTWIRNIANQMLQNRLDAIVRKSDSPFTSASVNSGVFLKEIRYAGISTECQPANWAASLKMIEQELRRALVYGFTTSELQRVQKDYAADLENDVQKASTRDSKRLARYIMAKLNRDRVFQSPLQRRDLLLPVIQKLTTDEVSNVFKQNWAPAHRLVMVTGNTDLSVNDTAPENLIRAIYKQSRQKQLQPPDNLKTVVFPYLAEPAANGEVVNQTGVNDLGIVQIDFKNGVRLNLKKTDFKAGEILFKLAFGLGKVTEPADKSGLGELSEAVINESGLGGLTEDELTRALAGKSTYVKFGLDEQRFFFSGQTISKEIALLFQLLHAHLTDPAFRQDAYTLAQERFRQHYLTLASSIDGAMVLHGKRFLASGDPRFGMPSYNRFKTLTLDDTRNWIEPALKTAKLELSLVGDFDTAKVIALATQYLGSLAQRKDAIRADQSQQPVFPKSQTRNFKVETEINKGLVVVAYPTEGFWDIRRTRRLSVLAQVFSEKLREKVREELGAAYSPFAYNQSRRAYPQYGVFQAFIHVDPKASETVIAAVKKIAADLAQTAITNDELRRALDPLLTSLKDLRRQNKYWLNSVLLGSLKHPEQLEWSRMMVNDFAAISTDELFALAQKYLENETAAMVIVTPR